MALRFGNVQVSSEAAAFLRENPVMLKVTEANKLIKLRASALDFGDKSVKIGNSVLFYPEKSSFKLTLENNELKIESL